MSVNTRTALHTWLRCALKAESSDSLHTLAVRSGDDRLVLLVAAMDRMLFHNHGEVNSSELASTVAELRTALASKSSVQMSQDEGLPPLYPK